MVAVAIYIKKFPTSKFVEDLGLTADEVSLLNSKSVVLSKDGIKTKKLTDEQKAVVKKILLALFRISQSEYTIIGLKGLIDLNRRVVKNVYMEIDDKKVLSFIKKNNYALGLEESDFIGNKNKWLAMWD